MSNFSSQFVKINAQESVFSDSQNLTTFSIAGNSGQYDLSESTILFTTRITNVQPVAPTAAGGNSDNVSGVYDTSIRFTDDPKGVNSDSDRSVSTVTIIKNAEFKSSVKGSIEDLREVGCLKNSIDIFSKDFETKTSENSLGNLSNSDGVRGFQSSPYRQLNKFMGNGSLVSKNVSHNIRVKLSDISDFCEQATVFDTVKYGDLRIRTENLFDHLLPFNSRGQDDQIYEGAFNLGQVVSPVSVNSPNVVSSFVLNVPYINPERDCPFFVGMKVALECTFTTNPGGVATVHSIGNDNYFERTISSMSFNQNNDNKVTINFALGITVPNNNDTWSEVVMKGRTPLSSTIVYDKVQLELKKVMTNSSPDKIQYKTYMLQQDTSVDGSQTNHNKNYMMESDASDVIIAFPYDVLPRVIPVNYRIAIDNNEEMPQNVVRYSPLDYDRIQRGMVNEGMPLECLQLSTSGVDGTIHLQPEHPLAGMILQPLPMTGQVKNLQLRTEFVADQLRSVNLYKSILKEI